MNIPKPEVHQTTVIFPDFHEDTNKTVCVFLLELLDDEAARPANIHVLAHSLDSRPLSYHDLWQSQGLHGRHLKFGDPCNIQIIREY